jgi:hypothetical protein
MLLTSSPYLLHAPPIPFLDLITRIIFCVNYRSVEILNVRNDWYKHRKTDSPY